MKMHSKAVCVVLVRYFKYCTKCTRNFVSTDPHSTHQQPFYNYIHSETAKSPYIRFPERLASEMHYAYAGGPLTVRENILCSYLNSSVRDHPVSWTWSIVWTHTYSNRTTDIWLILKRTSLSVESKSDLTVLLWQYEQGQCRPATGFRSFACYGVTLVLSV
jgi:hypothetical protein